MDDEDTELSLMLKACESIENATKKSSGIPLSFESTIDTNDKNHDSKDFLSSLSNKENLSEKYSKLKDQSDRNKEALRKLKLVKFHKHKNNLDTLDMLVKKWRSTCQKALTELLQFSSQQPPVTMLQLMQHLGIDPKQVNFDINAQAFMEAKVSVSQV